MIISMNHEKKWEFKEIIQENKEKKKIEKRMNKLSKGIIIIIIIIIIVKKGEVD